VIVFSSSTSKKKNKFAAESSFRTAPKKSRRRRKSSLSAPARRARTATLSTFEVKVGDKVLISKYGGTEVKIDDKKYTLVREDDILGIIG
jgi:chaperonin GroES